MIASWILREFRLPSHPRVKYPLTLIGIVVLIGLVVLAAVAIDTNDESTQRFVIIVGIVGTTVTALLAILRTEINAAKVEKTAAAVAEVATTTAATVATRVAAATDEVRASAGRIEEKIDANTEISERAFHEANTVNVKLAALTANFNRLLREATASREGAEEVAAEASSTLREVVDETAVKVAEVHDTVVHGAE